MFSVKRKTSGIVQHLQKDINTAISKVDIVSVQRLLKDGADANDKDIDGRVPLHFAAITGNVYIVNILLENGADLTHVTDHGDTPLHTASSKGHKQIVDILLQHIKRDKLNSFVNAKSFYSGLTALHLAAKRGSLDVVKSLLSHGATYNPANIEGIAPIAMANDPKVATLLCLIQELFSDVKNGNVECVAKLKAVNTNELLAILNTRDNHDHTLVQVAVANRYKDIADQLLKMLKQPVEEHKIPSPKRDVDKLRILVRSAEIHLEFSAIYLPMLKGMSQPYETEKNLCRWKTLKEGSYYLGNAFKVVKAYKECVSSPIENIDVHLVNDTLEALEFCPEHISRGYTDEAYGGEVECFVSKGQGTKYYNLLHSEWKKDVRSFIEMVELNIDTPLKRFLTSTPRSLRKK